MRPTFWEYFDRMWKLDLRMAKIKSRFIILQQFHPIKALFLRRRFNRILRLMYEQKIRELNEGYRE